MRFQAEKVESDDEKPKVDKEKPKEEEEKLKKEEEKPDKEEEKLKKEEEKPDKKEEKEPDAAEEKKPAAAEEESPRKTPKQQRKSKLPEEAADDDLSQSESSHFMFYLIVCSVLVIAAYLGVHNKKKIIGLIVEGRSTSGGRRGSRGGARYRRLDKQVNEEDAMPLKGSDRHNVIY
uniref:Uncharacterized protein n=1 Tax=Plectus sambesii TaxID=2011161 RepID=A0A914UKW6_9BILA